MSVLENLRKGTDSTSTRLVVGVVILVFIFWGAGTGSGDKTSIYAEVNGTSITDTEFRRAFSNAARAAGRNLSDEEKDALAAKVLDQLIEGEALQQEAERLGVFVSDEEVAREVVKEAAFQKDGKFEERTYERTLKANGTSRGAFEGQLRRGLQIQKLLDLASRAVAVTDAEVEAAWRRSETQVDLTYVRLPTTAFLDDVEVSDGDRDAFVQQNGDKLKARYDELYERRFNLPKRYELSMILLRTDLAGVEKDAVRAKAEELRAQIAGGGDFAELARAYSEDLTATNGGELGLVAAGQLDPVLVSAADESGANSVTKVVETGRGFQILKVGKVEDARVVPFDEAKNELALSMIREERAPRVVGEYAAKIVEAWKAKGEPPRELTEPKSLPIDSTGPFSMAEETLPRIGDSPELEAMLATSPVGQVIPVPFVVKGTTYVVALTSRTEPDPSGFEAQKAMLRAQLTAQRQAEWVETWRASVVARAKIERAASL
ncbi:MAG: SurA N-terminal domain-containing protein [Myxococcota bacterium]